MSKTFSAEFLANQKRPPGHSNAGKKHRLRHPHPFCTPQVNAWRIRRIELHGDAQLRGVVRRFIHKYGDPRS